MWLLDDFLARRKMRRELEAHAYHLAKQIRDSAADISPKHLRLSFVQANAQREHSGKRHATSACRSAIDGELEPTCLAPRSNARPRKAVNSTRRLRCCRAELMAHGEN